MVCEKNPWPWGSRAWSYLNSPGESRAVGQGRGWRWRRGSRWGGQDVGEQGAGRGGGGVWARLSLDAGDQEDGIRFMDLETGRRSRLGGASDGVQVVVVISGEMSGRQGTRGPGAQRTGLDKGQTSGCFKLLIKASGPLLRTKENVPPFPSKSRGFL